MYLFYDKKHSDVPFNVFSMPSGLNVLIPYLSLTIQKQIC